MAREQDPRTVALNLLARREHGRRELAAKLRAKGFDDAQVSACIEALAAERLLSDARFAESFVAGRRSRGYGAARIAAELRERGVDDETIRTQLAEVEDDWRERAERERRKKFGAALPLDARERARQARFLHYRGFSSEQIRAVLHGGDDL